MSDTQSKQTSHNKGRRQFLADLSKGVGGGILFAATLGLYSRQTAAVPALALRPPGALAEERFQSACIRCGLCVRDCPPKALKLARLGDGVPTGTVYFTARDIPCILCNDPIYCVEACPTGALDPGLTDIDESRMGLAVLSDHDNCLNYQGLRCEICYRACPLIDKAITLVPQLIDPYETGTSYAFPVPVVQADRCTGCGQCEHACPLEEAAIRILPHRLAQGRMGDADAIRLPGGTPRLGSPLEGLL